MSRSEFTAAHCEQVTRLLKLCPRATDAEISEFLGIGTTTIHRWKVKYPEFREAIAEGKARADAKVAEALYERATGATVWEDTLDKEGRTHRLEKRLAPDTAAAFIWLKNRRPQDWRDRTELVSYDVKLDLIEYAKEYARRIGPEAAQRFLEDHGYKGRVLDLIPESVKVSDSAIAE